jgi:hypothetical protein
MNKRSDEEIRRELDEALLKNEIGVKDVLRGLLSLGIGAASLTEERIKNRVSGLKLPKESLKYLVDQGKKGKEELIGALSGEIRHFLSGVDISRELRNVLSNYRISIKAEIEFKEKRGKKA